MFSNLFSSSISLATVTPSLVTVGAPNVFSMTTLRPLGPERDLDRVGQGVDAAQDRLRGRFCVEQDLLGSHVSCALLREALTSSRRSPRTSSSRRMRCSSPSILISVPAYLPKRIAVALLDVERRSACRSRRTCRCRRPEPDLPSAFSLAVSGMMMPPLVFSLRLDALDHDRGHTGDESSFRTPSWV